MERSLLDFFTQEVADKAGIKFQDRIADCPVTGIEYDSRKVKNGNLFFALPGLHTDGSLYIDHAINHGASVIVHENEIYREKKRNNVLKGR